MKTIFIHELRFCRKSLIIWLSIMLMIAGMGAAEYGIVAGDISIAPMIEEMPRIMCRIFGVYDGISIDTMLGYFACMFLWYCLIVYSHAAVVGASIISKEEDDNTAEFLFTKPLSRDKIITAKLLAAVANILLMAALTWLITVFALLPQSTENISAIVTQSMLGMLVTQLMFMGIGLLSSAIFRKKQIALRISVLLVVLFYFISVLIEFFSIPSATIISPFWYFNTPSIIRSGFPLIYLIPAVLIIFLCTLFTYRLYKKRDVRI